MFSAVERNLSLSLLEWSPFPFFQREKSKHLIYIRSFQPPILSWAICNISRNQPRNAVNRKTGGYAWWKEGCPSVLRNWQSSNNGRIFALPLLDDTIRLQKRMIYTRVGKGLNLALKSNLREPIVAIIGITPRKT